jgi:ATP-dependent DNA helicase RecQ
VIRRHAGESGIVYCMSRRATESLAAWLGEHGVRALPYHAGMDDEERHLHQDAFARDRCDVVVATVAFGMGIDKSNVRFVIHRDLPKSVEAWYQEIGRAGRDGLPSDCVLFYSWADVIGYDSFLDSIEDPAVRGETRRKTVELFRLVDAGGCRHQSVVRDFDEAMEPCGESCDVCRGETVDDLLKHATPGEHGLAGAVGGTRRAAAASGRAGPGVGALFASDEGEDPPGWPSASNGSERCAVASPTPKGFPPTSSSTTRCCGR